MCRTKPVFAAKKLWWMRVINRACWSNGCHYDKIFAGHQIIFLSFSFVQPMLFHSNQTSYDNRGRFCVVYIETVTSAIMVTPLTMQEKLKELISQYYEVVVQWKTFFALVNPNLPLTVLSVGFVRSTLKQQCWCQLTLCRWSLWFDVFFYLAAVAFMLLFWSPPALLLQF